MENTQNQIPKNPQLTVKESLIQPNIFKILLIFILLSHILPNFKKFLSYRQLRKLILTSIVFFGIDSAAGSQCFANQFPHFILSDQTTGQQGYYQAVIINSNLTSLFVGGRSTQMELFPFAQANNILDFMIVAKYSLTTQSYVWYKGYSFNTIEALALNDQEDTMAIANNIGVVFQISFVDAVSGFEKYYLTVPIHSQPGFYLTGLTSNQILFAGTSRMYLTAQTLAGGGPNQCGEVEIVLFAIDYASETLLFQKFSQNAVNSTNFGLGTSNALLDISTSSVNGQEQILMGVGLTFIVQQWYLGILKYDASTDNLSGYTFDYNNGSYFQQWAGNFHYINQMIVDSNTIYATTINSYFYYYGAYLAYGLAGSIVCKLTYTDSSISTLSTAQVYQLDYLSQDIITILSIQNHNNFLHGLAFDSTNQNTIYFIVDFTTPSVFAISIYQYFNTLAAVFLNTQLFDSITIGSTNMQILQGYIVGYQNTALAPPITLKSHTISQNQAGITSTRPSETCNTQTKTQLSWTLTQNVGTQFTYYQSLSWQEYNVDTALTSVGLFHFDIDFSQIIPDDLCLATPFQTVSVSTVTFPNQQLLQGYRGGISCTLPTSTLTPSCSDNNWMYSISIDSFSYVGNFIYINPTSNSLIIKTQDPYGNSWGQQQYIIEIKQSLASAVSTSFTFTYTISTSNLITSPCVTLCSISNEQTIIIQQSTAPANQTYNVSASAQSLIILPFTVISIICDQNDFEYSIVVTPEIVGQDSSFITYNSITNSVQWYTSSNTDVGNYEIAVFGTVNAVKQFSNFLFFNLQVFTYCSTSISSATTMNDIYIDNQNYNISQNSVSLQFENFTVVSQYCTQQDVKYSITVEPQNSGQSTNFITTKLSTSPITVSWYSSSNSDKGTFTINIIGTILTTPSIVASQSFQLIVGITQCQDTNTLINIFPGQKVLLSTNYQIGTPQVQQIVDLFSQDSKFCSQKNIQYSISVSSDSVGQFGTFIQLVQGTTSNIVQWQTNDQNVVGTYQLTVTGQIQNALQNNQAEVSCILIVELPPNSKIQSVNNLQSNQTSSNQNCNQSLKNNTSCNQTSNTTNQTDNTTDDLSSNVQGNQDGNNRNKKNNQSNRNKQNGNSQSQFNQQNSQGQQIVITPQWRSIKINNKGVVDIYFSQLIQVPQNLSVINQTTLGVSIVPADLSLNKYLKFSWSLKSFTPQQFSLQINFLNPLYVSLKGKHNLDQIKIVFLDPYLFSYFNSDLYMPYQDDDYQLQTSIPQQLPNNQASNTLVSLASNVQTSSTSVMIFSFTANLLLGGSLTMLWGMINSLQLITQITQFNVYQSANIVRSKAKVKLNLIEKLTSIIQKILFWNYTLLYLLESYLQMTYVALQAFYNGLEWSNHIDQAQSIFTILSFVVYLIVPITMTIFLTKQFKNFRKKSFISKYGSVIENLSFRERKSAAFISLFCYRRLLLAVILAYLADYPFAQIILVTLVGLLVMIILGIILPFREPRARSMEYFNELTIMFCYDHMFLFTDFVDDPLMRYNIGYSLIAFTLFNFSINIIVSLTITISGFFSTLKKIWIRRRFRKQQKRRKFLQIKTQQMSLELYEYQRRAKLALKQLRKERREEQQYLEQLQASSQKPPEIVQIYQTEEEYANFLEEKLQQNKLKEQELIEIYFQTVQEFRLRKELQSKDKQNAISQQSGEINSNFDPICLENFKKEMDKLVEYNQLNPHAFDNLYGLNDIQVIDLEYPNTQFQNHQNQVGENVNEQVNWIKQKSYKSDFNYIQGNLELQHNLKKQNKLKYNKAQSNNQQSFDKKHVSFQIEEEQFEVNKGMMGSLMQQFNQRKSILLNEISYNQLSEQHLNELKQHMNKKSNNL